MWTIQNRLDEIDNSIERMQNAQLEVVKYPEDDAYIIYWTNTVQYWYESIMVWYRAIIELLEYETAKSDHESKMKELKGK